MICDYCAARVPKRNGWHIIVDEESYEGPARIPCPNEPPLSSRQVADLFGAHINTIKRIPADELPYFRIGQRGDRRYNFWAVMRYLQSRTVEG